MSSYKQYKKVFKQYRIYHHNIYDDFNNNLEKFLNNIINKNPTAKIEHIIQHHAHDVTIIYSVLEEIKNV